MSALLNNTLGVFNNVRTCAKQQYIHRPHSSCPWRAAGGPAGLWWHCRLSRVAACQEHNSFIHFNGFGNMCYLRPPYFDGASSFHYPFGKSMSNKPLMAWCIHTHVHAQNYIYKPRRLFLLHSTEGHSCGSIYVMTIQHLITCKLLYQVGNLWRWLGNFLS